MTKAQYDILDRWVTGATGESETDMLYREYLDGPNGMKFELFYDGSYTSEDVQRAKKWLRSNHDAVSIHLLYAKDLFASLVK